MWRRGFASVLATLFISALVLTVILVGSSQKNFRGRPVRAAVTDPTYNLGVLVVKYFPLTPDGQKIDISVTGDVGDPYPVIRDKTVAVTNNLLEALPKASRYLHYKDPFALYSLWYSVVETKEYTQAVPMLSDGTRRPNYFQIMTDHNICNYVETQNVKEVWLWAYQGPTYPDSSYPYLNISESKMAGPFGDISNSPRYNDMPKCSKTYRVYTFNYGRGTAEAMESWGHQIEAEIDAVNSDLFRNKWQGPNYPQTLGLTGRCGSVHNPPNARSEYDRNNPNPQNSDCLDWNPDSIGTISAISCQNWTCQNLGDNNNPALNYMIWNWQNMPGRDNSKTYQGKRLRNWWDVHGDFDNVMGTNRTLFLPSTRKSPVTAPTVKDSFNRVDSSNLGAAETGQSWGPVRGSWGISGNQAYPVTACPAPGYAVVDSGLADGVVKATLTVNPQDLLVLFRFKDTNNLYFLERAGQRYLIEKKVDGVGTMIAEDQIAAPQNGDVVEIWLDGPTIEVFINGTVRMTATDSSVTGTNHGLGNWCNGTMRFDDFTVTAFEGQASSPPPPPPDTTAPTVTITSPANNATVKKSSTVKIAATASDNVAVSRVDFAVDGTLKCSDATSPYECNWVVPSKPRVVYTLSATAFDSSGNNGQASIKVTSK